MPVSAPQAGSHGSLNRPHTPHLAPHSGHTPHSIAQRPNDTATSLQRSRSATSYASRHSHHSELGMAAEPDPLEPADLERPLTGQSVDIGPPPDGGREAWLCVTGTFLQLFCVFGLLTSAGQLLPYYATHQLQGYSKSTISWIASIQPLMVFGCAMWTGRFFDVHGSTILAWSGTVLSAVSIIGIAFSKEYYQLFLSHMAFGISGTLIYSPATAVAGHWFLKRRSTAVGIIVGGSGLGGVIYPIMIKELLEKMSFRNTMLTIMGFNFVLMFPACFWVKARLPPRRPPPLSALKGPWKETRYVFLCLGVASYGFNILTPYFNASNLAVSNNQSDTIVAYSVAILQAGSFVGRIIAGLLADRFGVWTVYGSLPFLTSITMFAFWVGSPIGLAPTLLGLIIYGTLSGGWFTLAAAATAVISPTNEIGMRIGMMWSSMAIPALLGPVISGELITVAGNRFKWAGVFTGCTFFLAGLVTLAPLIWLHLRRMCGHRPKEPDAEVGTEGTSVTEQTAAASTYETEEKA